MSDIDHDSPMDGIPVPPQSDEPTTVWRLPRSVRTQHQWPPFPNALALQAHISPPGTKMQVTP